MITSDQLAKHAQWLADSSTGERLNLSRAKLSRADLSRADLSGAKLSRADLSRADLIEADLSGANLRWANLSGADLREANLRWANLSEANLSGADLRWANLRWANLSGANLSGADLSGANLTDANLSGANLSGVKGLTIASDAPERLQAVAKAILNDNSTLNMSDWHTCETTHCLAGWAIHQAGELGKLLEASAGPHMAGLQLLGVEAAEHFYDSNEDARAWLESIIK